MELAQIRHFIAVAETGSFTKGAKRAAVSQPAISASIARLEAELDVKLIDRRRSPTVPTAAGVRLLEAGKAILYTCNKVKAEIKTIATPKQLRIGVLQSLSSRHVAKLLESFRDDIPVVTVQVSDGTSEELAQWLTNQKVDIALSVLDESTAKFPGRVLAREPYVLAVSQGHRFVQRQSIRLVDLNDEPIIVRSRCEPMRAITDMLASRGINLRIVYETDQDDRALALVASGLGVALLPAQVERPDVRQVAVTDLALVRSIGLLWSPDRADADLEPFLSITTNREWDAPAIEGNPAFECASDFGLARMVKDFEALPGP
jgi:DNA-binding transcriptional LysR family regulator